MRLWFQRRHYRFSIPLLRDTRIPFISPTDIGRFGAFVLSQPQDRFKHGEKPGYTDQAWLAL